MEKNSHIQAAVAAARAVILPEVMDVRALSAALSLSESSIRRLLRSGRIPGTKLGRRWFCTDRELLRALTATHEHSQPGRPLRGKITVIPGRRGGRHGR